MPKERAEAIRFDGAAILLTGAARGMGLAHAKLLAQRGARVMLSDAGVDLYGEGGDATLVDQAAHELRAEGALAFSHSGDLANEATARDAVQKTVQQFGRIDAIVHNAGFTLGSLAFEKEGVARLEKQLGVNTRAAYALAQEAWPHMQNQGVGRIVLTGSTAMYGIGKSTPYSTAKASYIGLGRALAAEGATQNIHVNVVAPGGATRMSENMPASGFRDWFLQTMRPELVSPLVGWLTHKDSRANGEVFVGAGGRIARMVLAETRGLIDQDLSLEKVRAYMDVLLSEEAAFPIERFEDSMDAAMALLGFDGGAENFAFSGQARGKEDKQ
jgi:NAD(P)-dependent dehydrogenase (short-subunit alcohol dehydrogenase family)